jgi:hypothetical protein
VLEQILTPVARTLTWLNSRRQIQPIEKQGWDSVVQIASFTKRSHSGVIDLFLAS